MADKKKVAEEEKDTAKKSKAESSSKAGKAKDKKSSVFARIAKYFRECKAEVKKIVWPTPKATFKNTGVVLVVLVVVGLFVFALDTGFTALLRLIMDI